MPKSEGKHQDLRDVQFFLASEYSNENALPKLVALGSASEETATLVIKGSEEWQLKSPSGKRSIKAVVWDRAGLKSSENGVVATRFFTNLTLVPSSLEMSITDAKENGGVPAPAIKELEEFFAGKDWRRAGYTVSYSGAGFSYDEESKMLRIDSSVEAGTYHITVALEQGGNIISATYTVNLVGQTDASINQSQLKITDETNYASLGARSGAQPLALSGPTIIFGDVGGVQKGTIEVPYTGFETRMKVKVKSISQHAKVKDASLNGESNEREFEVNLPAEHPATTDLVFWVVAEDVSIRKCYTITFARGESAKLELSLVHKLLDAPSGVLKLGWAYNEIEIRSDSGVHTKELKVAKGESVSLSVRAGSNAKVSECRYSNSSSSINNNISISGEGGEASIDATEDFRINVTLQTETSAIWENYPDTPTDYGYSQGKIKYYNTGNIPNELIGSGVPEEGIAIKTGSELKFTIEGINSSTYKVICWKVNGEEITENKSDGSITLDLEKTELTIHSARGEYRVSVKTARIWSFKFEVGTQRYDGASFTAVNNSHSLELRIGSEQGELVELEPEETSSNIPEVDIYLTAKRKNNTNKYHVVKWQISRYGGGTFENLPDLTGEEKTKNKFNLTSNTVIRLIIAKDECNVDVTGGNNIRIKYTIYDADGSTADDDTIISAGQLLHVERRGKIVLKPVYMSSQTARGWKVGGTSYPANTNSGNIKITSDMELTISDITQNVNVELILN